MCAGLHPECWFRRAGGFWKSTLVSADWAFRCASALSLFLFAGAKIYSLLTDGGLFHDPDPIFYFVARRTLLWLVAIVELGVGAWLLGARSATTAVSSLLWLSCLFLCYRAGLRLIGADVTCGCGGSLYQLLKMTPRDADWIPTIWLWVVFSASLLRVFGPPLYAWKYGGHSPGVKRRAT